MAHVVQHVGCGSRDLSSTGFFPAEIHLYDIAKEAHESPLRNDQPCILSSRPTSSCGGHQIVPLALAATSSLHQVQSASKQFGIYPSASEWRRIRGILEDLYIDQDKTLVQTMSELRLSHKFIATEQMFKKRIKLWNLDKNLKQNEVENILGMMAERRARGKDTEFFLRGRKVDIEKVHRFQQRKRLRTSVAVARYMMGQSKACQDLRPMTPVSIESSSWTGPDQLYENTLRAFCAQLRGLVDCGYYWIESSVVTMPPSELRGKVSDFCSNLVASKNGILNSSIIRNLSLLMESIVHSDDAWIHCRLIYMLWLISTAGHVAIAKELLAHMNGLVKVLANRACAQYRFVQQYSSLEVSRATMLAGHMISIKADVLRSLRVEETAIFRLRSLEFDVFWRQREQGTGISFVRAMDLLERCNDVVGPLGVETLTILKIVLEDFATMPIESPKITHLLEYLIDTKRLMFSETDRTFNFDGHFLHMEAATELAYIYCQTGLHDAESWIFERLLPFHKQPESGLRREYELLVHISRCSELIQRGDGKMWLLRKQAIEDWWEAEVEAVVPLAGLLHNNLSRDANN